MKLFNLFLLVIINGVLSYDYQKCVNGTDCKSHECCIVMVGAEYGACYHLGKDGEYCMTRDEKGQDIYNYFCPCAGDIVCGEFITGSLGKCGLTEE